MRFFYLSAFDSRIESDSRKFIVFRAVNLK